MMRYFAIYDPGTGAILYTAQSTADEGWIAANWPSEDQAVTMLSAPIDQRTHWVDGGAVTPRAAMTAALSKASIAADGVDEAVLSDLPDPCLLEISGAVTWGPGEVTGGSAVITSTAPGRILLRVTAGAGFLAWEGAVDAH